MEREKLDFYRAGLAARRIRKREAMEARRLVILIQARAAARQVIALGAKRVLIFGSVLSASHFHERSDVDMLVYGLPPDKWRNAFVLLEHWPGLEDIVIDLKFAEDLRPVFLSFVERQGEEITP